MRWIDKSTRTRFGAHRDRALSSPAQTGTHGSTCTPHPRMGGRHLLHLLVGVLSHRGRIRTCAVWAINPHLSHRTIASPGLSNGCSRCSDRFCLARTPPPDPRMARPAGVHARYQRESATRVDTACPICRPTRLDCSAVISARQPAAAGDRDDGHAASRAAIRRARGQSGRRVGQRASRFAKHSGQRSPPRREEDHRVVIGARGCWQASW